MSKILFLFSLLILSSNILGNGIAIIPNGSGSCMRLVMTETWVTVENQVAIVTTRQTFYNQFSQSWAPVYSFPASETATGTSLRWLFNGEWYTAKIGPGSSGGTGSSNPVITEYLGDTPITFGIPHSIEPDSMITVELTYVQLLPYSFGKVNFNFPSDYTLIQSNPVDLQYFSFQLNSFRTIDSLVSVNHSANSIVLPNTASLEITIENEPADRDIDLYYILNSTELGLSGLSTFLDDSASVNDSIKGGYFTFIAEPEPEPQDVIKKAFSFIIDCSGSMGGYKMEQAKNAASFIVEHLNEGDIFNLVMFHSYVTSFKDSLVEYNEPNKQEALSFINQLTAGGMTHISGAFDEAVPDFMTTDDSTANIIIFFTDGLPTAGIRNINDLISHINSLINLLPNELYLFNFGIGENVNKQLLTTLALENKGFSQYVKDEELEEIISQFYLQIRNPVLLNTTIELDSANITEVYPDPLPNLYIGQQMVVSGRYITPEITTLTLRGEALGQPVSYTYDLDLSDSAVTEYQFLLKVWAKQKIEHLTAYYYTLDPSSLEAALIKEQIIELSLRYGVLSDFASFVTDIKGELIAFTVEMVDNYAVLNWETGAGANNHGFYIERKINNGGWEEIGFIPGEGYSSHTQQYTFRDDLSQLSGSGKIFYRLRQMDQNGEWSYSPAIHMDFGNLNITDYTLNQNYPNPFNPSTSISFALPETAEVRLIVFNAIGEEVATLANEELPPGLYKYQFNAHNLPSGIYYYRLQAGAYIETKKMMLIK